MYKSNSGISYTELRKGGSSLTDGNEEKLVRRAKRGNVEAYGSLIEIYKEYLYRTAYVYTKNETDSLDLVSECILKGFRSIRKLKEPTYFKTWLTRILINCIKTHYEKQGILDYVDFSGELPGADANGQTAQYSVDLMGKENNGSDITPEEKMDLYNAIECLSENYKTVIILKYFSELRLSEISEIMGIPEGSVSAYLTRAKRKLRDYLKEDYLLT